MKRLRLLVRPCYLALVVPGLMLGVSAQVSSAWAQGSLIPPGTPAPTMKTLAQIEPRIAITNTGFLTISQPGSYYLTTNITVNSGAAINITADNVTVDLNGFTLFSTASLANGSAILLSGGTLPRSDILVMNGHVRGGVTNNSGTYSGSGFLNGVYYAGPQPVNCRVANVSVSGCGLHGIYLGGDPTEVESCTVRNVGGYGIVASRITRCSAYFCGNVAIYAYVASDCYGYATSGSDAVFARVANNCFGIAATNGIGINAITAQNSYGQSDVSHGVSGSVVTSCYGVSVLSSGSGGSGVNAQVAQNCYGLSHSFGQSGIRAYAAANCYGHSTDGEGVTAWRSAQSCVGESENTMDGIFAGTLALNCEGEGGAGVEAQIAVYCYGTGDTRSGVIATIANCCMGTSRKAAGVSAEYKYNMP